MKTPLLLPQIDPQNADLVLPVNEVRIDVTTPVSLGPPPYLIWARRYNYTGAPMVFLGGEQSTHVAASLDGLSTVEFGPNGPLSRSLDEFIHAYDEVAIGALQLSRRCEIAVATQFTSMMTETRPYGWSFCAAIEASAVARRCCPPSLASPLERKIRRLATALEDRASPDLSTCSSWIDEGLKAACRSCWPTVPWPARTPSPIHRQRVSTNDVRPSPEWQLTEACRPSHRSLITPSDLFVSPAVQKRIVIGANQVVLRAVPPNDRRNCERVDEHQNAA